MFEVQVGLSSYIIFYKLLDNISLSLLFTKVKQSFGIKKYEGAFFRKSMHCTQSMRVMIRLKSTVERGFLILKYENR